MKNFSFLQLIFVLIILFSVPVGVYLLNSDLSFFSKATGKNANIIINPAIIHPKRNYSWKNLAQGGEERNRMFESVVDEVSEIKPNYIRIDHTYDFYSVVRRDTKGDIYLDWSEFDKTIEDILSMGATPFLSLSGIPPELASETDPNIPRSWNEWKFVVRETIEHVSGRNDLAIENVYYEVWNEPDLFGNFKTYGERNYLTAYEYSARAAQEATNILPFKIGGPATTAYYPNWLKNLVNYTKEKNLPLQFISWHQYSKDLNDYSNSIDEVKDFLSGDYLYANLELIISESGYSSDNDIAYDSKLGAIHTIALAGVSENEIDKIFSFEIKDGPGESQYWGRWGILTHEKFGPPIKKIRYKAFEFLNNISGVGIDVLGEGTWVKSFAKISDDGVITILLVNYDPDNKHVETVPVSLINMPFKNFEYQRTEFLGNTIYESVSINSQIWESMEYLDPNSAVIIKLVP